MSKAPNSGLHTVAKNHIQYAFYHLITIINTSYANFLALSYLRDTKALLLTESLRMAIGMINDGVC
jgi:hypothetical protein